MILSSTPFDDPRSKSKSRDQMSRVVSLFVKVRLPGSAQDGYISFPAPTVNRVWANRSVSPVFGEMPISHRLLVSPPAIEKITALDIADQHPGQGSSCTLDASVPARSHPAWTKASYAPVFTAKPPLTSTSHQSRLKIDMASRPCMRVTRGALPSADQTGCRAAVKFGPTRRGEPHLQELPIPRRSRGTRSTDTFPHANPICHLRSVGRILRMQTVAGHEPEFSSKRRDLVDAAAIPVRPKHDFRAIG